MEHRNIFPCKYVLIFVYMYVCIHASEENVEIGWKVLVIEAFLDLLISLLKLRVVAL